MNYDEYYEEVKSHAFLYIDECFDNRWWDEDTSWDDVCDEIYLSDSVTGNASGSYTCSRNKALEYVRDAMWDHDILQILSDICINVDDFLWDGDPEGLDVSIRYAMVGVLEEDLEYYFHERQDK